MVQQRFSNGPSSTVAANWMGPKGHDRHFKFPFVTQAAQEAWGMSSDQSNYRIRVPESCSVQEWLRFQGAVEVVLTGRVRQVKGVVSRCVSRPLLIYWNLDGTFGASF